MRVAFVQKDPLPDPALMVLGAAVAFRGHESAVFIPAAERNLDRALRRWAPAAVVFAPATGFEQWAFAQARRIRRITGGAPMIFTGGHATDHPESALEDGVDLVMLGDPETTLPELLLKIFDESDLPGTTGTLAAAPRGGLIEGPPRHAVDDLDDLPLADFEIYRRYRFVRHQSTLPFCTGRGVPENVHAGFRLGAAELARRFQPARRHSVAEAIQRLHLHIARRPHYRRVGFRDDSLLMDGHLSDWLAAFLNRYRREIGLPFSCLARPDQLGDDVIQQLAAAGCELVRLGIEAGDESLRRRVAGVAIPDALVRSRVDALRAASIRVQTVTPLGVPGETTESAVAALDLNLALRPDHAFVLPVERTNVPCEVDRLANLLPLVVDVPALRAAALRAIEHRAGGLYGRLYQAHHDASFIRSGELAPLDIARIAASMSRRRGRAA